MASLPFSCVVGALIACAPVAANFLAAKDVAATSDIITELLASIAIASDRRDPVEAHRFNTIEQSISNAFQAAPKNKWGGLEPPAVRHVVHGYFSKEHGWHIDGLEPYGVRANGFAFASGTIEKARIPAAVEWLLEFRRAGHGLQFQDIVVMIATLERVILDEATSLLHIAYSLNGFRTDDMLDAAGLVKLLISYLVVYKQGDEGQADDFYGHNLSIQDLQSFPNVWEGVQNFANDAVLNFAHKRRFQLNPFTPWRFTMDTALQIVVTMVDAHGKWQNQDCRAMKEELINLDPGMTGRVPLDKFYAVPPHISYNFNEPAHILKRFDALDESVSTRLQVRIANYITGPMNCIAHSAYYSVCCLNECVGLMTEIEGNVRASEASPATLLHLVGNLSSSTIDAPRTLPQALVERLHAIADQHDGTVPLDGRLFAQWLHYAFPHECPFPRLTGGASIPRDEVFKQTENKTKQEDATDRQNFFSMPVDRRTDGELMIVEWSNEEELPLRKGERPKTRSMLWGLFHKVICLPPLVYLFRAALAATKAASNAYHGLDAASKQLV